MRSIIVPNQKWWHAHVWFIPLYEFAFRNLIALKYVVRGSGNEHVQCVTGYNRLHCWAYLPFLIDIVWNKVIRYTDPRYFLRTVLKIFCLRLNRRISILDLDHNYFLLEPNDHSIKYSIYRLCIWWHSHKPLIIQASNFTFTYYHFVSAFCRNSAFCL